MHTARVFSYHSFPCLISSSVVETENFTFKYATAFYLSPSYDSAPRLREKKFLRISPPFSSRVKKDRCAHDSKNSESRHRPMTILSIRALFHGWRSFAASAIIGIETHASDHIRMLRHKFAVRAEYVQRGSWRNEKEKRKKEKRHSRSANVSCTQRATPGNEGAHRRGQLSTAEMQKFDLCVGTLPRAMLRYERSHMWTVMPRIHARVNMQVYIYIYIYGTTGYIGVYRSGLHIKG